MLGRGLAGILLAAPLAMVLSACSDEPPKCSDPKLETAVRNIIIEGSNPNSAKIRKQGGMRKIEVTRESGLIVDVKYTVDTAKIAEAVQIKFSNESNEKYDKDTKFRSCHADIAATVDESKISDAISIEKSGYLVKEGFFGDHSDGDSTDLMDRDVTEARKKILEEYETYFERIEHFYAVQVKDSGDLDIHYGF